MAPSSLPWPPRARIGSARWIGSLAAVTAVPALSIDMSLPAQPTLMRVFGVGSDVTQLTLSLFLLGYAVGQLVVGTLSDAVGRRPALLAGLGVYTVASLACAVTGNLWLLVTMRFVQGTGAAAGAVIGRAMVRDTHTGAEAARLLATMIAVLAIAPMVAPLVGGVLLEHLGWRAIFATLCLCGVALSAMAASSLEET
ncbi:MAG TPA: MFS transporter, partial [Polyangiaceae bacterium]|nr:MFS transporter [Polyangiaceae bacterium]